MTRSRFIKSIVDLEKELGNCVDEKKLTDLGDSSLEDYFIEVARKVIKNRTLTAFKNIVNSDDLDKNLISVSKKSNTINDFLFWLNFISLNKTYLLLMTDNIIDRLEKYYNPSAPSEFFKALELEHSIFYSDVTIKNSEMENLSTFTLSDNYYNIQKVTQSEIKRKGAESSFCFVNYYYEHAVTNEIIFHSYKVYLITYENKGLELKELTNIRL